MTSRKLPALLGLLAVALLVTGILLWANPLHRAGVVHHEADPDVKLSSQAIGQVSTALTEVLTYDYAKPQTNQAAAAKWLTGDATGQYRVLFAQLQKAAAGQKLSMVAKVVASGVISAAGDTAQLLMFVDQRSTRVQDKTSRLVAGQVEVQAVRHGDTWQISELHVL